MVLDLESLERFEKEPGSASGRVLRLRGLAKVGLGLLLMGLVIVVAFLLAAFVEASADALIPAVVPFALTGLVITCIGGLQALSGRPWADNPQWVRVVFLVVVIPAIVLVLMGGVGILHQLLTAP